MLRVSSLSTIFGGHKKKSAQVLEAFDAAAPAASPGLAGDTSPRYVWDKRTASLVSLDSAGASSADTVLLATPSQSASASPELPPDSLSLTPGHISSIQLIRERLYSEWWWWWWWMLLLPLFIQWIALQLEAMAGALR